MKKILSMLLAVIMLVSCMALGVNASEKSDVLAALKQYMPVAYQYHYYVMFENILNQVEVNSYQADQLLVIVNDVKDTITVDRGIGFHDYTPSEQSYVLKQLQAAADILNLVLTVSGGDKKVKGDGYVLVSTSDGKKLGTIDSNPVATTNVSTVSVISEYAPFAVIALAVLAGVSVIVSKKKLAAR